MKKTPVILIDELDLIEDDKTRKTFAGFLHNVSDQEIQVKFIVCEIGIAKIAFSAPSFCWPPSCSHPTRAPAHDARWEIIQIPAEKLKIEIDRETLVRIGQISDGFPYYVHLIGEALFWAMFDDEKYYFISNSTHFDRGLRTAMEEAEPTLKADGLEKATEKYKDDYKEVLWAFVDDPHLRRQLTDIYDTSYKRIMEDRSGRELLNKSSFTNRLNSLKTERHGNFLRGTGAGWYELR